MPAEISFGMFFLRINEKKIEMRAKINVLVNFGAN